ncbi:MAG: acetolactate synthase large subunit [Burkholderiaceae bacterium]|nr:acetolactate synthase large subunit [Burkholderiaceae bacterium]
MNGAESLVRTLVDSEVDVCFTNPGTSEMHFVAALDRVPGMRCVLGLFEGVATGAADGYYRMSGRPAATLLHLGPGLANGLANLHNARRAGSGIVNIVGDHATYHQQYDAPLASDCAGVARPMSHWVHSSASAQAVAADGATAVQVARTAPGQIATLILPADTAWNEAKAAAPALPVPARPEVDSSAVDAAARLLLADGPNALLLGGVALRAESLEIAGRIAAKTGCRLLAENMNARLQRGAGRVQVQRIPYPVEQAVAMLADLRGLVQVGSKPPVGFFAYPDKPSILTPDDCTLTVMGTAADDLHAALEALAEAVGAGSGVAPAHTAELARPQIPGGALTPESVGLVLAALMPEQAIIVDEAVTTGRGFHAPTAVAAPHEWLSSRGGAIGYCLPCATGAAVACPDRKVIALSGDGSAMYTVQSLWTMARESLDVLVLVFANRGYQILRGELKGVGVADPGPNAVRMLTVDQPVLDFVALASGQGIAAERVTDVDGLVAAMRRGLGERGPRLIEVVLP